MSHLNTLQHQFWSSLRAINPDDEFATALSAGGKLSEMERLEIYRNTMRAAHTTALAESFNCCEKILGNRYFNKIANQYFYDNPAKNQNLNIYGRNFPHFLLDWIHNHPETKDFEYLPDLAMLEYAYEQAYYCKDDPLFDFESFSKLKEYEQLQIIFKLSNSLTILKSKYPIYEIWRVNLEQDDNQEVKSISESQFICITRDMHTPVIHKIDEQQWWVLNKIQCGFSLETIHAHNEEEGSNVPLQIIIPKLIQKKWICGYTLNNHPG